MCCAYGHWLDLGLFAVRELPDLAAIVERFILQLTKRFSKQRKSLWSNSACTLFSILTKQK